MSAFYTFDIPFSSSSVSSVNQTNGKGTDDHGQEKTSNCKWNSDTLSDSDSFCTEVSPKYHDDGSSDRCKGSIGCNCGTNVCPAKCNKLK